MLGIEALPAVLYLAALYAVPESPRWLAMRGRDAAALEVLVRSVGRSQAEVELRGVKRALSAHEEQARLSELFDPALRRVLTLGLLVAVLQQITGINAVFFYAPTIFQQSGVGTDAAFMQAIYVGLVNLVFTVLAISLIDRLGRRPLLIAGLAGIAASMLLLAYGFGSGSGDAGSDPAQLATVGSVNPTLVLIGILGFVASFAMSLGPVMWVLFSELFSNRMRGIAISFVGLVNSAVSFVVQLVFPWQLENFGNSTTFLVYAAFALVGLPLVYWLLPETKGKSLEALEAELAGKVRSVA
jgi:sugar porter (SP) family MFS transporter